MTTYDRLFGSGPRGALIGTVLFVLVYLLEDILALPIITESHWLRFSIFFIFTLITLIIIVWSIKSLPVKERGKHLVTSGAFKYFRHPLYAAFVSFFNFGFAVLMNNWIYMLWTLLMIPVWHLNIKREEELMKKAFGQDYIDYCAKTGRFFVKIFK